MDLTALQNLTASALLDDTTSYLAQEYKTWQQLFQSQPVLTQRFLEAQGKRLAEALIHGRLQARFTLPDKVSLQDKPVDATVIPAGLREQRAGSWALGPFKGGVNLRQCLDVLESHPDAAVAASAGLVRYAMAMHLVHWMLPSGRNVVYRAADGEEIPTLPVVEASTAASAITMATDAIAESGGAEDGRGELMVPYVEAARRFYLPQWVAFDDQDRLLVNSFEEAQADLASMQRYLRILHTAVSMASYMVACPEYQEKRYGMLGQLVNQGRALARYQTCAIIDNIRQRAAAQTLNRGLSIELPYFDDQVLHIKILEIMAIPFGRIMFVPGFVVLASRKEQVKVAQDTRLSPSTRKHLLDELRTLEHAFEN